VAMIVFPRDHPEQVPLAGEVLEFHQEGVFDLVLVRAVIDELDEAIDRDLPE